MRIRLEFKPQDCWLGVFWKREPWFVHVWLCLLPTLPIHLRFERHKDIRARWSAARVALLDFDSFTEEEQQRILNVVAGEILEEPEEAEP